jgi:hypothetical protein
LTANVFVTKGGNKVKEKKYFLFSVDGDKSSAMYTKNVVTITHHERAHFTIADTGSGYEVTDVSPGGGTKTYSFDYSEAADLFASLKIFYHNADRVSGEYWSVFQGEKL